MSSKKRFSDDPEMRDWARVILKGCGGEGSIIHGLQALMNRPADSMPRGEALKRLRALRAACPPFAGRHHSLELSPAAAA